MFGAISAFGTNQCSLLYRPLELHKHSQNAKALMMSIQWEFERKTNNPRNIWTECPCWRRASCCSGIHRLLKASPSHGCLTINIAQKLDSCCTRRYFCNSTRLLYMHISFTRQMCQHQVFANKSGWQTGQCCHDRVEMTKVSKSKHSINGTKINIHFYLLPFWGNTKV